MKAFVAVDQMNEDDAHVCRMNASCLVVPQMYLFVLSWEGETVLCMSVYMVPAGLGYIAALSGNSIGEVNIFESLPGNVYAHP